ncbi:bifunctional apoptosis regulator isoform X3 [Oryzias latipes]|uniref:bifunctional apoptosis regulator isoform X3 n=1 Tax=Oryzias latipes TaxID=8090 RepID=UPI0009DB16D2|nr:bifunctional apoptosis regulator isoform X3 [Oryzias latipes]
MSFSNLEPPLTEVVTQGRTSYTDHDFGMLQQMEGDSAGDGETELLDESHYVAVSPRPEPAMSNISENEFSCHCCYDILVNPTTLTCGHNFCRHCLALWWESSHKNECPECREKWEGFPKINILMRDATDKLFSEVVQRRRMEIQANPKISRSLLAFQRHGDNLGRARTTHNRGAGFFFSGVLTALTCVAVVVLVFHWGSGVMEQHDLLISKPVSHWTSEDVVYWLENLGPWTEPYRGAFQQENVNGRLLLMLGDEELMKKPYNIENSVHRRAVLAELDRVKALGVKPPQNLWEYKLEPSWQQWVEFLVKYCVLPYQLIAEFAWDWLAIHYWTSRFIIVNAMLLSVLEGCFLWRLWTTARLRTLPQQMWNHLWKMLSQGFAFALMWPFVPQFVCNCLFYWALYFSPIINIDLVVQQLMHPETQAQ